ncbi:MAG: DUF4359 domain-containing protein [Bacteroidota bacterium]
MRVFLVLLGVALGYLAFSNPDMADFTTFVETQSEEIILQETGDGVLGRVLSSAGSSLAGSYVDRVTEQKNYVLFSVYTVDLDGSRSEEEHWRFLGIAGRFLELEEPGSMRTDDQ